MAQPETQELINSISILTNVIAAKQTLPKDFMHIPNLYIRNYQKQNPEETGNLEPDKAYPVIMICAQESDMDTSDSGDIVRGFEIIAFISDERGETLPLNFFQCEALFPYNPIT